MPTLLEETEIHLQRSDLLARRSLERRALTRSPGIHLSGVHRYIAERIGKLDAVKEIDEDRVEIRWAIGHAIEEFTASLYEDFLWQPREIEYGGIFMNVDGHNFSHTPGQLLIEEVKTTEKKVRRGKDFLDEWLWMQQGLVQCKGWGSRMVRWHVWYLRGNYDYKGPQYWRYVVRFSDEEIERSWRMTMNHKHGAVPE